MSSEDQVILDNKRSMQLFFFVYTYQFKIADQSDRLKLKALLVCRFM